MNIDLLEGLCRLSKMEMQYSPFWFCNFLQKALAKNTQPSRKKSGHHNHFGDPNRIYFDTSVVLFL